MLPATHAVIVGIDRYPDYQPLSTAVKDARKMHDYLKNKFQANEENLKLLTDDQAKKADIIDAISSIAKRADARNESIIFFFSGYSGRTKSEDDEQEGILCPVDVLDEGGLSDSLLLQLFDQVAKSCGNNITVLLDCPSEIFSWVNPASFVVVAPDTAKESSDGGAFTQAMLKVLEDERIENPTVEAFAGHVQAAMDGVEVRAFGVNVNRRLFNVKGEKSHHAFIPCRALSDGRVVLCIGAAQGVRVGAVYGIYRGNIKGSNCFGNLEVDGLDDNGRMAIFDATSVSPDIPNFFFAVEQDGYFDPIKIFVIGRADTKEDPLVKYSGWTESTSETEAAITALVADNNVSLKWNGFADDPKIHADRPFDVELNEPEGIQREIRRAARFHYLVGAQPPNLSSISSGLKLRVGTVGVSNDNILDNDVFASRKTIELSMKTGESFGPYALTIVNKNTFSVWPYVFICDPERFTILNWYVPPAGLLKAPLGANKELVMESPEQTKALMFSYGWGRTREYTYMKIFVTKERMDFTAFQQWFTSPTEDELRGHTKFKKDLATSAVTQVPGLQSPEKERERDLKKQTSPWASMRLTILETFVNGGANSD